MTSGGHSAASRNSASSSAVRVDFLLTNPLLIEQFAPVVEELVRRGHRARLVLPSPRGSKLAGSSDEHHRILEACRVALDRAGIPHPAPDRRADVVVTVLSQDHVRKWRGLKFKFRYGIGLLREGFHYQKKRITRFDGVMVHGDFEVPIFSEWIDPSRIRTMGMPRHDMALRQGPDRKQARERLGLALDDRRPVIAFLPTWDEHSGTARFAEALMSIADRYRILVKPHVLTEVRASEIGNRRILDRLPAQRLPSDYPLVDVLRASDVVVADAKSGVGPELALIAPDVPLVLTSNLPAEAYFEQIASLGILVTEPRDLAPAIADAREGDSLAASRRRLAESFFAERSGAAAARAADALLDLVDSSSQSHRLWRAFHVRARR